MLSVPRQVNTQRPCHVHILRFHRSDRNAGSLRRPPANFLMQLKDLHIAELVRERIAATDQDERTLSALHTSAREDFNLRLPRSQSELMEEAADRGNGPEVRCNKLRQCETLR